VLGTIGLDVEDNALDPVLALDAFIVEKVERRHVLEAEPAADLASQKWRRTTERAPAALTTVSTVSVVMSGPKIVITRQSWRPAWDRERISHAAPASARRSESR
jgi:hypothetical protein